MLLIKRLYHERQLKLTEMKRRFQNEKLPNIFQVACFVFMVAGKVVGRLISLF